MEPGDGLLIVRLVTGTNLRGVHMRWEQDPALPPVHQGVPGTGAQWVDVNPGA